MEDGMRQKFDRGEDVAKERAKQGKPFDGKFHYEKKDVQVCEVSLQTERHEGETSFTTKRKTCRYA